MNYIITETLPERDYELLDSGDGEKLERFGKYVTARPDPQALWPKRDLDLWKRCLLYTSDAADERSSVDLGGRRII